MTKLNNYKPIQRQLLPPCAIRNEKALKNRSVIDDNFTWDERRLYKTSREPKVGSYEDLIQISKHHVLPDGWTMDDVKNNLRYINCLRQYSDNPRYIMTRAAVKNFQCEMANVDDANTKPFWFKHDPQDTELPFCFSNNITALRVKSSEDINSQHEQGDQKQAAKFFRKPLTRKERVLMQAMQEIEEENLESSSSMEVQEPPDKNDKSTVVSDPPLPKNTNSSITFQFSTPVQSSSETMHVRKKKPVRHSYSFFRKTNDSQSTRNASWENNSSGSSDDEIPKSMGFEIQKSRKKFRAKHLLKNYPPEQTFKTTKDFSDTLGSKHPFDIEIGIVTPMEMDKKTKNKLMTLADNRRSSKMRFNPLVVETSINQSPETVHIADDSNVSTYMVEWTSLQDMIERNDTNKPVTKVVKNVLQKAFRTYGT